VSGIAAHTTPFGELRVSPALPDVGNSTAWGIQWIFMPFNGISWEVPEIRGF
jgi:hypothetical protein